MTFQQHEDPRRDPAGMREIEGKIEVKHGEGRV
jgi:hypothetical protein